MRSLVPFLLCFAAAPAFAQSGGRIQWTSAKPETDFAQAARTAAQPTVVYFTAPWEPACARLDEGPLSDDAVVRAAADWQCLIVEFKDRKASLPGRTRQSIAGLPTVRFYTKDGAMVNELVDTMEAELYARAFRGEGRIYKPHPMDMDVKKWHDTHRLTLRNGNVVDGRLREMSEDMVFFLYGPETEVQFKRNEIRSIEWIRIRRIDEAPVAVGAPVETPTDVEQPVRPTDPEPGTKPPPAAPTSESVRQHVDKLITALARGGSNAEDKNELIEQLSKSGSDGLTYAASVIDKVPQGTAQWIFAAITRARERKTLPILREKLDGLKNADLTVQIINTLVLMQDPTAAKVVMKHSKHESVAVRGAVIEALGQLGDRTALRDVAAAVVDEDRSIRGRATTALIQIARKNKMESTAYMALRSAASGAPETQREQVPLACSQLGAREAVSMITPWLRSREPELRANTVIALGDLGAEEVAGNLLQLLEIEPEPRVRVLACNVLGKAQNLQAVPRLIDLMGKEQDMDVRLAASRALQSLTRQNFGPDYDQWRKWWAAQRGVSPDEQE